MNRGDAIMLQSFTGSSGTGKKWLHAHVIVMMCFNPSQVRLELTVPAGSRLQASFNPSQVRLEQ